MSTDENHQKIWDEMPILRHLTPEVRIFLADKLVQGTGVELTPRKPYGPIVITKVKQTCHGCPSAWTVWDKDGKEYDLRYRYGVGVLRTDGRGYHGEMLAKFTYGDDMAGICTLEEFVERIGGYLALSEDLQHVD